MVRPTFVVLVLLASAAATPAEAHDWYTGLRDGGGKSCCDDRDCRPVGVCVLPDRKEGLLVEGACLPVPRDKVLGVASPDGGAHACWTYLNGRPDLHCVILPGEA
jgi:hypothetical protein